MNSFIGFIRVIKEYSILLGYNSTQKNLLLNTKSITIPKSGIVHIIKDGIHQGEGSRLMSDLLEQIVREFAIASRKYMTFINDVPYAYSELQLSGLILPGLIKNANAYLTEHPIERWDKSNQLSSFGRVDFWANYRGFDVFMELKHSYDAFNTHQIKKKSFSRWHTMNNTQNGKIKKYARAASTDNRKVYTIALQVITVYHTVRIDKAIKYNFDHFITKQKQYMDELSNPKPNWSAVWMPHQSFINNAHDLANGNEQRYPAVLFMAHIENIA
jgi:hypothetical protein